MRSLTIKEKAELFDLIATKYYNTNFGSFSKSESDLLMFSIYLDKLIDKEKNFDDYNISKDLGIVQANVRQLKKKKQLIYPRDYKWYEAFLNYSQNATLDNTGRIVISIPDPNVYIELQHAIEELGGYVEIQLNSKLLKIPPGYFIELLLKIHQLDNGLDNSSAKKLKSDLIKKLNSKYHNDEKLKEKFTEKSFSSKLTQQGIKLCLGILEEVVPGGAIVSKGIDLCKTLFEK